MRIFQTAVVIGLALWLNACAEQRGDVWDTHLRGSEEFKNFLRLGPGANRPAASQAGSQLNLTSDDQGIVSITMDPAANVWSWVIFDTSRQPLISGDLSILDWSRNYIAQHKAEIGVDSVELSSFANTVYEPTPEHTYVNFQRQYQGRLVKGALLQLIFLREAGGWKLREVVNNSFGPITLRGEAPPALAAQYAIDASGIPALEPQSQRSIIHPQLGADGHYEFRYATEWTLADKQGDETFYVTLDDESQSVLAAHSNRFRVKQELSVETYARSYVFKDQHIVPFAGVKVDQTSADINGIFDSAATTVNLTLSSARGTVINLSASQTNTLPYIFPVTLSGTGKTTVPLTSTVDPAALNAYMALLEVNDWVSKYLTAQQASLLSTGIATKVNEVGPQGSEYCNAFFTTQDLSLNFFAQGAIGTTTCANTALIKDVMYHEWGHALDNIVGVQPGITDGAFSEGIGDINACLATGNPILGQGFFLNDSNNFVRTLVNARTYPPATPADAEVHSAGQIIGGAFWDMRMNLVGLYGVEEGNRKAADLFYHHLLITDVYTDSFKSLMRLDNPTNPTVRGPNYCAINKAFGKHGLLGGLAAEGDACLDVDQGLKVRVDTDNGSGSLTLLASAFGAESIAFCPGKQTACPVGASTVEFTQPRTPNILTLNKAKRFYQGSGVVTVKAGETYTLVSRDKDGKSIGVKVMSFAGRDRSKDLSKTITFK